MNSLLDINKLCSGLFSDSLDDLGLKKQVINGFLSNKMPFRFMGRARTVKIETIETKDENIKTGLTFIGSIKEGEVLLVEGSSEFAYFGEMMTRLSIRQGVRGVIIDGLTRDTIFTHDNCQLPVIARGYSPVDIKGRGRVSEVDVKINIGHQEVEPGDLIFADSDAVVVIPKEVESDLLKLINQRIAEEERIVNLIDDGVTIEQLLQSVKEF